MNWIANWTKYGYIGVVNFTIGQWNHLSKKNGVEMYSTHNEAKSVIPKRFIWKLKNKIYKYKTSVSKNVYIDKLDDIVNKYNNTYHSTIKIKSADVKSSTHIDSSKEINNKNPKFKIDDTVRISKCQNIFAKGYTPNWSGEAFVLKKAKNTVLLTYVFDDRKVQEIVGTFYENEFQRTNQKEFRIGKVMKRKGDKLYVQRKGKDTVIRLTAGSIKKT